MRVPMLRTIPSMKIAASSADVVWLMGPIWNSTLVVGSSRSSRMAGRGSGGGGGNARVHASGRFPVSERLAEERATLRPLAPERFDWSGHRTTRVPIDGYLRHGGCFYRAPERLVHERVGLCFDRDQVWINHRGVEVARYPRSYERGVWLPPPVMRPEPPQPAPLVELPRLVVAPPELAAYAELCA